MCNRFTFLLAGVMLVSSASLSAQTLTLQSHKPYHKDSLYAYKLPPVAIGDSGLNCVWDFSGLSLDSADILPVDYYATTIDTNYIGVHREHTNYYMHYASDTLWQSGYETSRMCLRYKIPVPVLCFPFAYGDSVCGEIVGEGQYCHSVPLSIEGRTIVKADAKGRLILPDMTIDSVLRVHSITHYTENLHKNIHVREERHLWYSVGCRYPLLENRAICTFTRDDTITFASSYYIPQEQERLKAPEEELTRDIIEQDSLLTDIHCMPNPVLDNLQITYTLTRAAQVYVSLHYNGGIKTYQTAVRQEEDGQHTLSINMSGMPSGNYVAYIHADDTIVSENILKL